LTQQKSNETNQTQRQSHPVLLKEDSINETPICDMQKRESFHKEQNMTSYLKIQQLNKDSASET